MAYGISVYDGGFNKMGYLAAHCILGDIPIKKNQSEFVEVDGRIFERGGIISNKL